MNRDLPDMLNRPLWGKPRPRARLETDPVRIELALLRRDRDALNVRLFLLCMLAGKLISPAVFMTIVLLEMPPNIRAEAFFSLQGFAGAGWLVVFALFTGVWMMPMVVRLLSERGVIPVREVTTRSPAAERRWVLAFAAGGALLPLLLAATILSTSESTRDGMLTLWQMAGGLLVFLSPLLAALACMRRGDTLHCGACGYPRDETPPERCPECGNAWLERWRTRMGTRNVNRKLLIGAAVMMVVGIASVAASILLTR